MNPQHKLYDLEVAPPVGVWNRIAQELDELDEYKSVAKKLQNSEAPAPAFAWENISRQLDEQDSFDIISKKLLSVEVNPPPMAWDNIRQSLDAEKPVAKVVPMYSTGRKWIKYAVAACVVGLLGIVGYYLSVNSSKDAEAIQQGIIARQNAKSITPQDQPNIAPAVISKSASNNAVAKQEPEEFVASAPTPVTTKSGTVYASTIEKNKDIQGRYMMLMTENGDVVRLSKKLKNIADCIAGEDGSTDCNNQIAAWQEQMVKTPLSSTPDNFLDLLELANKENGM